MQGPIERSHGLVVAILITGTLFAVAHLDFTLILWPYYVAVAAIYGTVTYLTKSILPAVVLHTGGNLYSNLDLWLNGQAEWQAGAGPAALVWKTGADESFWITNLAFLVVAAGMVWAYFRLAGGSSEVGNCLPVTAPPLDGRFRSHSSPARPVCRSQSS
jgi:ABC-type transport system involved in cytochrome bd biosynthesis fused ATPase/permease subunit